MNILIDGRVFSRNASGVTTYLVCALREWAKNKSDYSFYVILPKGLDKNVELKDFPSNIQMLDYKGRFQQSLPNIVILQLLVPKLCRKLGIDIYFSPVPHLPFFIPKRTKKLVTVHDVVNIEMKETMAWTNRLATSVFFGSALKKADCIWANSYYTRGKVDQYFPKRKCKEIFVGDSADQTLFSSMNLNDEQKKEVKEKYGVKGDMLLFVGSLEPRKNLSFLLRMMPDLYREHGIQLVVVGGKGWKNSDLRPIVEAPDYPQEAVVFCGYVTSSELVTLYNTADCFVSAALMEGFGMPQLEAMLCGCPIVTAHNTAMIEVAKGKDGATTVEGYDPEEWKRVILHTLKTRPKINQDQLSEYDWADVIRRFENYLSAHLK